MPKVAILLGEDFEDSELHTPHTTLLEHEVEVVVIGAEAGQDLHGKRGRVTVSADQSIDDADPAEFDLLVVPGGYSPDKLRTDTRMVRFVRAIYDRGTPIAAICHAPSLLIDAGIVEGARLTSWPSIRTDLRNAGAEWVDEELVVDGQLITSRQPDDLTVFTKAILERLGVLEPGERAGTGAAG